MAKHVAKAKNAFDIGQQSILPVVKDILLKPEHISLHSIQCLRLKRNAAAHGAGKLFYKHEHNSFPHTACVSPVSYTHSVVS